MKSLKATIGEMLSSQVTLIAGEWPRRPVAMTVSDDATGYDMTKLMVPDDGEVMRVRCGAVTAAELEDELRRYIRCSVRDDGTISVFVGHRAYVAKDAE